MNSVTSSKIVQTWLSSKRSSNNLKPAKATASLALHELATTTAVKIADACSNTHGIIVSSSLLNFIQKEYIEQFYFEKKGSGGGGAVAKADRVPELRRLLILLMLACEVAAIIVASGIKFG